MKIESKTSVWDRRKKQYTFRARRKCGGFQGYWTIKGEIYWTGNSYFVTVIAKPDFGTGFKRLRRHFHKDIWRAKRFVKFIANNFPDYLD